MPGGLVTKRQYDGAGRVVKSFVSNGELNANWDEADDVTGDIVLEQAETSYDPAGNVELTTYRQRFHDATATGDLSGTGARVSYLANYYDQAHRLTASVDVGTNAGSVYSRPSSVPSRSDTVLVSSVSYNAAGWVDTTTDPRGIETRTFYDNLGRTTKTVEAYSDGTPGDTDDKTVEYTYDGSGHVLTVKAYLTSGSQTTQFVYGARKLSGSTLNSNDVLSETRYPDPNSGSASLSEVETYTVNHLGQRQTLTDRNGTEHTYSYDVMGRLTTDAVTLLGSGVDGAVRRIEVAYDSAGRPFLYTSFNAASGGSVVNEVQQVYNGFGQVTTEYQSHSGAVNTSTTPKVQYAYSEAAFGANHSRLVSMTYPNGRVLNYHYDEDAVGISRLTSLSEFGPVGGVLENYTYLGLGTVVTRGRPGPGVELTYVKQGGEGNGDAGDQYTGLDRFGRVVEQRWRKTSDGSHTDRFKYGYDRDGNRLYKQNLLDAAFSELYHADGAGNGYDDLNQLVAFQRGALSDSNSDGVPDTVASETASQAWDVDALGNFEGVTTNGSTVSRTHNLQNELTNIGGTGLGFDPNGNLTTNQNGRALVYDAWNRLVQVKNGSTVLVAHQYDALNRRVVENAGTARDLYYTTAWQVIEEREGGAVKAQQVWSAVYVSALVLRDRDANGSSGDGLEERLYAQQDANWNVTALVSASGSVLERFVETPYGATSVLTPTWGARGESSYNWVYLHQGERFETESKLYDHRNRWFDPVLMRWVSNDPIGFAAGDVNLYRGLGDNPLNCTDASGLIPPGPHMANSYKPEGEKFKGRALPIPDRDKVQYFSHICFCSPRVGEWFW